MRFFKAFIISLSIYALLIWLFVTKFSKIRVVEPTYKEHIIKIDIRNIPLPKKVTPAKPIVKDKPKAVQEAKITPKPKVIKKPKTLKKPKKVVSKKPPVKKKPISKKKPPTKKTIKKKPKITKKTAKKEEILYIPNPLGASSSTNPKKQNSSDDLASFFSAPQPKTSSRSFPNRKIKKLYGSSFHNFTPTQKRFIEDNLDIIQQITQRTLDRRGYPEGAGKTGQEGTNVVSFNLHPNGDISNLRLKTRTGYRALDENTLTLIRVAYKDYPYPKTTTKIIFYVHYTIYGY